VSGCHDFKGPVLLFRICTIFDSNDLKNAGCFKVLTGQELVLTLKIRKNNIWFLSAIKRILLSDKRRTP